MDVTDKVQEYLQLGDSLKAERAKWDSDWDELRRLVIPRRVSDVDLNMGSAQPGNRFSATAALDCTLLAAACMSLITPSDKPWFAFRPKEGHETDEAEAWCNKVSQIVRDCLSDSNYYTEKHEFHLDRGSLGTGCLLCEERDGGRLSFSNIPCGLFASSLDGWGEVDTCIRWFKFSAAQIIQRFGTKGKIADEKIQDAYDDTKRRNNPDFTVMHVVRPRKKYNPKKMTLDATQRPYESVYICEESKCMLQEDGYYEFPYMVSPFLKWGSGAYGIAPAHLVKHVIKDEIFGDRMLNTYAEVAMFPRLLVPAEMTGEIDMRAGGKTVVPRELLGSNFPKEWATAGRCDFLMERMEKKEKMIDVAYLKPMIQVITSVEREMTATEVIARQNEQVIAASPTFTLLCTGLTRLFRRIFGILGRAGALPDPPKEFQYETAAGVVAIPPVIRFTGRLAVSLERSATDGMMTSFNIVAGLAPIAPEMLDAFDKRKIAKKLARTSGMDEDCIVSDERLAEIDQQRAEQQQAEMEMKLAQMGAAAAKDGSQAINQLEGGNK